MTKHITRSGNSSGLNDELVGGANNPAEPTQAPASNAGQQGRLKDAQGSSFEIVCKVPAWKLAVRLVGFTLVIILDIALVMSDISAHRSFSFKFKEMFLYAMLIFINSLILVPALFEIRHLLAKPDGIKLATIWWKSSLGWEDILAFYSPNYLARLAMIRTRRCVYLLNKRDLSNYAYLESFLREKVLGQTTKTRE